MESIKNRSIIFQSLLLLLLMTSFSAGQTLPKNIQFQDKPEHVVLIIIDGLSYETWDRLELPMLENMIETGSLVDQLFLPPPAHPHEGRYAKLHTCSTPNPILMSGTLFIDENTTFIQEQFSNKHTTAFVGNAAAYRSINNNYHLVYQKGGTNQECLRIGKSIFELLKPNFMRLHFQQSGGAGRSSMTTTKDEPWHGNIWAENSPYIQKISEADQLVGEFVRHLSQLDLLDKTTLFIMGDHGQAKTGWHPPEMEEAAITTLIMWGAGIRSNIRIPYGEIIDVVPTVCYLMDIPAPEKAQGRILSELLIKKPKQTTAISKNIEKLNSQFQQYRKMKRTIACTLEQFPTNQSGVLFWRYNDIVKDFYDMERFLDWREFSSIVDMLNHNQDVIHSLERLQKEIELMAKAGEIND